MANVELICMSGIRTSYEEANVKINGAFDNKTSRLLTLGNLVLKSLYQGKKTIDKTGIKEEIQAIVDELMLVAVVDKDNKGFIHNIYFVTSEHDKDFTEFDCTKVVLKIYEGKRKSFEEKKFGKSEFSIAEAKRSNKR